MSGIITGTRNPSQGQKSHVIGKVPVGHIVQTQSTVHFNADDDGSPNTLTEINTLIRVTITPTSTRNKLYMHYSASSSGGDTTAIEVYEFYDVTGSDTVEPHGESGGNRNEVHWGHRGSHHDSNDNDILNFSLYANVPRTTETVYTVRRKAADGTGSRLFNFTSSDNASWGFTGTSTLYIQEIQTY